MESNPDSTRAVLITFPEDESVYIYVPNDGSFGIELVDRSESDQTSSGLLIRVNNAPPSATDTSVSCNTCEGSYGTGCSCTCKTITVKCKDGEPCVCPGGGQCSGSCNRKSDWREVCENIDSFYDTSDFYQRESGNPL